MLALNLDLSEELQSKLFTKLKKEDVTISQYFIKILETDLNSCIDLGKGFYYNGYTDRFFNKNHKEILLTETQKRLLLSLVQGNGEVLSVKELIEKSWKSRGNVSIFTFRNMIKAIRDKTYYELVKSHSNKGYSINVK